MNLRSTWLLLASLPLLACVEPAPEAHEIRRNEIMGGYEDVASSYTVGLYAAQGYAGGICSGTLIAPNLVLTAQHCIAEVTSEYVLCGETQFGEAMRSTSVRVTAAPRMRNGEFITVNSIHIPGESKDMCGNDIALLVLTQNIGPTVATPIIPRLDLRPQQGEVYSAIGYGHDGSGRRSMVRRRIDNRVVQCDGNTCPPYTSVQSSEFLGSDGTCQGDSGGTALDAQNRVFGALSRGPRGCAGSVYSGVFEWADWMREVGAQAATYGGYEPHFWVTHGISELPENDQDLDDIDDTSDNCVGVSNPDQIDTDANGVGDACDDDLDGDGVLNENDNCPFDENPEQEDTDGDEVGDACDDDIDGDDVINEDDNCPFDKNSDQLDSNEDGEGDACTPEVEIESSDLAPSFQGGGCGTTQGSSGWIVMFLGLLLIRRRS